MELPDSFFPRFQVQEAVYTRVLGTAPWGMDFITYHHTKFGIVTEGSCYIDLKDGLAPIKLSRGSCYLLSRGNAFRLRDELTTIADDFEPLLKNLNGRILRHGGDGALTTIIGGRFIFKNDAYPPLLDLLPPLIHFKVSEQELCSLEATIQLLASEIIISPSGVMIDRLADIFFIQSLRRFLLSENKREQVWLGVAADEQVAAALQAMHEDYTRSWTIAELAKKVGMSRAVFAARFKEKMGTSPITYLLRYRLYQAQDMLSKGRMSIAQVAADVGYESEPAFYKAFKRETGISPGEFRKVRNNAELIVGQ